MTLKVGLCPFSANLVKTLSNASMMVCLVHLQLGVQKYSWRRNHMPTKKYCFLSREISGNAPVASVYSVTCCLSANAAFKNVVCLWFII